MTQVVDTIGYDRIESLASIHTFAPKRQRFIFVRHGETEGNRTRVYQVPHIPLNETGEAQAARAAKSLAQTRIGKLVASPMARAWRTVWKPSRGAPPTRWLGESGVISSG